MTIEVLADADAVARRAATVRSLAAVGLGGPARPNGFRCSFNRTFRVEGSPTGWWVTPYQFGID